MALDASDFMDVNQALARMAYTHYQPYVVPEPPPPVAVINTSLTGGK